MKAACFHTLSHYLLIVYVKNGIVRTRCKGYGANKTYIFTYFYCIYDMEWKQNIF